MKLFDNYPKEAPIEKLDTLLAQLKQGAENLYSDAALQLAFSCIDLTSLNITDNTKQIKAFVEKVNNFPSAFPDMPQVAAICVYPNFVQVVKETLTDKNFSIAAVVGGFPAAQTFLAIKTQETELAVKAGASEVDMVIAVGEFQAGNTELVTTEIQAIKQAAGEAHLKVILETGLLSPQQIWQASLLAMEAGADFIKTSTGKHEPAATPQAVFIMCLAIKAFYERTGKKVGLKPAGGIRQAKDALLLLHIVNETLGEAWLNPNDFRIGASSLANHILSDIARLRGNTKPIHFF